MIRHPRLVLPSNSSTSSCSGGRPAWPRPSGARRPPSARAFGAGLFALLALVLTAAVGCSSGAATGTSSGAGSVGCSADSECVAFSATCCDCIDSAAHNSEVRGLTPSCQGKTCDAPGSCKTNTTKRAQCEAGACILRTAENLGPAGYDTSCKVASDCVGVVTSFACAECGVDPDLAINKAALAAYQAAYKERFAGFRCPPRSADLQCPDVEPPSPTCENNVCKVKR